MLRLVVFLALVAPTVAVGGCAQGGGGNDGGATVDGSTARDGGRRDSGVRDGGRPTDAGMRTDSGTMMTDAGPRDGGMMMTTNSGARDAGPRDSGGMTCPPAPGMLVIDEVMISSVSGSGDRGEWFEVVNVGTCTIDLTGLTIVSPAGTGAEKTHTVTSGSVAPGRYFVFALDSAPAANHFLPFDYAYGTGGAEDVIFNNSADWLELRSGATVIDRVAWPSGGYTNGKSRMLPGTPSATANDTWANLCDSTAVYSTTGGTFYGTPQMPNGTCM